MNLQPYFADLENRIDPPDEERMEREWKSFADLELKTGAFRTARGKRPSNIEWQRVLINDALQDEELMIYRELYSVHEKLQEGSGELLSIRNNYGTGIIPSMLGAELFLAPREIDTLPAPYPLPGGQEGIARMLQNNKEPDFSVGLAGKTFRVAERYLDLAAHYPKVKRYVNYYNPDLQGPLALCEAMWGSQVYYAFYDAPELVEETLRFLTNTFIDFLNRWQKLCQAIDESHSVDWGCLHRGHCIIRNDAAMNISGDMYEEMVMPHDQHIISQFGGGVHFCGRGHHYIEHVSNIKGISCVNLSEPEMNDMEKIYSNTIDKGLIIFGLLQSEVDRALAAGRDLHGRVSAGASAAAWIKSGNLMRTVGKSKNE